MRAGQVIYFKPSFVWSLYGATRDRFMQISTPPARVDRRRLMMLSARRSRSTIVCDAFETSPRQQMRQLEMAANFRPKSVTPVSARRLSEPGNRTGLIHHSLRQTSSWLVSICLSHSRSLVSFAVTINFYLCVQLRTSLAASKFGQVNSGREAKVDRLEVARVQHRTSLLGWQV